MFSVFFYLLFKCCRLEAIKLTFYYDFSELLNSYILIFSCLILTLQLSLRAAQ